MLNRMRMSEADLGLLQHPRWSSLWFQFNSHSCEYNITNIFWVFHVFADLFHEPLGELNNSTIWETRNDIGYITQDKRLIIRLSLTYKKSREVIKGSKKTLKNIVLFLINDESIINNQFALSNFGLIISY